MTEGSITWIFVFKEILSANLERLESSENLSADTDIIYTVAFQGMISFCIIRSSYDCEIIMPRTAGI